MQLFQAGPERQNESAEIEKRERPIIAMPNDGMGNFGTLVFYVFGALVWAFGPRPNSYICGGKKHFVKLFG